MKRIDKVKLNNDGSTFLFVVVALVFIGLLAALIMALTVSGFRMKTVDYNSRQNFYESEEFSGKIYSEIGMNAVGILGEAYVSTMGKLQSSSITNENALNEHIKELYYENMMVYMRIAPTKAVAESYIESQKISATPVVIPAGDTVIVDKVLPHIKSMVDNPDDPTAVVPNIEIKGAIECDLQGETDDEGEVYPTITINDVYLQYIEKDTGFETNLTFDIVIRYPEWDFTYSNPVSSSMDIDTYLDYILISNDGIVFDGSDSTVYGCVATGTNGIVASNDNPDKGLHLKGGSEVHFEPSGGLVGTYKYEPLEIVVSDNIVITSSLTNESSMYVNAGGEIWCNSVILDRKKAEDQENTNKSYFQTNNTRLYLQDDLQLDGDYSEAQVIGGSFFGYSNNTNNGPNSQNTSSAIIINGNNSKINLSGLNKLYVNGLAYIDFINRNNPYRTGESLSVKGNQDIYMVPDKYMGENASNPMSAGKAGAVNTEALKYGLLNDFFGKTYLDPVEPYITKSYVLNSKTYVFYYLNFLSPSAQTQYVMDVLKEEASDTDIEKAMREQVKKNLSEMNMTTEAFLKAEADTLYAAGAVVTAVGGEKLGSATATTSTAEVLVNQMSFINRYRLMKSLLMTMTDNDAIVDNFNQVYSKVFAELNSEKPEEYPTVYSAVQNYLLNNSTITNFINQTKLEQYAPIDNDFSRNHTDGYLTYARRTPGTIYSLGNYTGVIVVDGDVEITGTVRGLVIATGSITVTGSGNLVADAKLVDKILTKEQSETEPKSDVFLAYPCVTAPVFGDSITQLQYSDVLYYNNWRKFEDETVY